MQKFFKNTLESKFIKALLYNTYLPNYTTVRDNDFIVKDGFYIYKSRIIKCTQSGYLGNRFGKIRYNLETTLEQKQQSYEKLKLKVDEGLELTTYEKQLYEYLRDVELPSLQSELTYTNEPAKYRVVNDYYFGEKAVKYTSNFISKYDYYDPETHEWLGKFLRCYRDLFNIDLMPFYNCNSEHYVSKYLITDDNVVEAESSNYKTLIFPINFNKTYTIAADCAGKIMVAPIMLSKEGKTHGVIDGSACDVSKYVYDNIRDSIQTLKGLTFTSPVTYMLKNRNSSLQNYERNLYLLLQLPVTNKSSIVVLEGDYTDRTNYVYDVSMLDVFCDAELDSKLLTNLSLMQINDNNTYAFSNRLIEYLLLNVVNNRDDIGYNIIRTQEYLQKTGKLTHGVWNKYLRKLCYDYYMKVPTSKKIDINGFVDKDMEYELKRKAMYGID